MVFTPNNYTQSLTGMLRFMDKVLNYFEQISQEKNLTQTKNEPIKKLSIRKREKNQPERPKLTRLSWWYKSPHVPHSSCPVRAMTPEQGKERKTPWQGQSEPAGFWRHPQLSKQPSLTLSPVSLSNHRVISRHTANTQLRGTEVVAVNLRTIPAQWH